MVGPVIISALVIVAFIVAALITPIISHILPKSRKPNKSEQLALGKILVGLVAAAAYLYASSNIAIPIIAGGIILLGTGFVELFYEWINHVTKNQIGRRKKGS